ncbi:anaerobic ribonucleoside-triphosphate reductase activating protein [Clostridium tertium]|jgi:anaerobic ribonucleoside-triphosphate reductase activating protein|uniref:anaerobic ribonucleoside-triphosphate reductase activating protein n=1 Tax=Clostridium TaxID=1485 RepID=UPI00019AFE82|nr:MULTISPECIES: anaerobic ribonucleoside-triphosphate reductase activating protein [Clostridium]EEH97327.1 anaerobic ribonucleoside-triphosphate reductase activating protein [Clostridium sp. 7_2_43FAA]MBU6134855.1 anaerobic ribonucleoside-triphosphate reductase activating protein [Clostridium tertium]MDB1939998.1 anaerobic ribonucleoside-triphosphate reductase activating protein [Clostridium tertium]MDB1948063.1 anaerobic ribonucleoside-triphosphate reductase activating protein [Clostridium te
MNYSKIRKFDVSNGPGIRTTLFVSGCTNNCEGCFNKDLQDFNYGDKWTKETEEEFIGYVKNPNVNGVNILGGEPMEQIQDKDLFNLLKRIKEETKKSIWLWSGYLYEDIIKNEDRLSILSLVDVLIDGRFEIDKRNISLKYRGSSNQRVIDVLKSLEKKEVVEIQL